MTSRKPIVPNLLNNRRPETGEAVQRKLGNAMLHENCNRPENVGERVISKFWPLSTFLKDAEQLNYRGFPFTLHVKYLPQITTLINYLRPGLVAQLIEQR